MAEEKKLTKNEIADTIAKKAEELRSMSEDDLDNVAGGFSFGSIFSTVAKCCNSCVASSSSCVPDSNTPNKCKGGCTATSIAL